LEANIRDQRLLSGVSIFRAVALIVVARGVLVLVWLNLVGTDCLVVSGCWVFGSYAHLSDVLLNCGGPVIVVCHFFQIVGFRFL
jgi:hypothetical protein